MRLIAGVDPGLYTAVVLLDLKGRVVAKEVRRDWAEKEIIEYIISKGHPILFAVDVAHVPSSVEKLAARFNAPVFVPPRDLSKEEKAQLAPFLKDHHLRDAYAAAVKAYRRYANRFRSLERKLSGEALEEAKEAVVKGHLPAPAPKPQERKVRRERRAPQPQPQRSGEEERVEVLRRVVAHYQEKCAQLQERLREMEKKLRDVRRSLGRCRASRRAGSPRGRRGGEGPKGRRASRGRGP